MTMRLYVAIAVAFGIAGLLAFPGAMGFKLRTIRLKLADFVLFAAMAAIGIIGYGDKFSPTNNPPNGLSQPMMMFNPQPAGPTVTETDVARGFSVVSVGTNEVFDFTMPSEGVRVAKWWLRGGSNDKAFVPGGIAMIRGEILDSLPRPSVRYCPLKATSLLAAGESEFWHQQTAANSTVYTWKDAYLWRNLSLPFSMQTEIFDDGDFEYRYDLSRISDMDALTNVVIGAKFGTNELGDVSWLLDGTNTVTSIRLHRMSEFDWDGDGLANEIDPDPYANNGDCHGQGEGWVLASFTNSAEIISAGGYTNWIAVVVENDTDGWWYSFTITANAFDATGHAVVRIDGKAVVLDRENNSATFLLMRGRGYPFSVDPAAAEFSAASYDGAQPQVEYSFGTGLVSIMAGVEILPHGATLHPIPGYSTAYFEARKWNLNPALDGITSWNSEHGRLQITPAGDGVFVFWIGSTNELSDTLYCDTDFDGYTNRQSVVVRYDPDPEPGPHVVLHSPNTLFVNDDDDGAARTNDFDNANFDVFKIDDDIVPITVAFKSLAYPTNGTLQLSAQGLRFWDNQSHVGSPVSSITMPNCQTPFETNLYVECDGLSHSQVDGFRLALEWLERQGNELGCATNLLTAAEPIAEPIYNVMEWHDGVRYVINPCVIARGGRDAYFRVSVYPYDYPAERITWTCNNPGVEFVGPNTGKTVRVRATSAAATGGFFDIKFGNCPSISPQINFKVCDLRMITVSPVFVATQKQPYTDNGPLSFQEAIQEASDIFSQAGVELVMNNPAVIQLDELFKIDYNDDASLARLCSLTNGLAGITVFSIPEMKNAAGVAFPELWKIAIDRSTSLSGLALAHEIGHALGLRDIYSIVGKNQATRLVMPFRRQMATNADWSGGSGVQRFYRRGITLADIADRCLMNGDGDAATIDLPYESLVGWTVTNQVGNVKRYGFARVPIGETKFIFTTNAYNNIMRIAR